jgi:hydroxypyruvate isomerase
MNLGLCLEMVYTDQPFEVRLARAAELGFKRVEMWFVDATYQGSAAQLAKLAAQYDVQITNTVIGSPDGSLGGGLTDARNRAQWLTRVRSTLAFNQEAHIPATIVCTGNVIPSLSNAQMHQSVLDGLKATAELAEKAGITLLLEPLNTTYDHAGYWLTSSDQGAELCRQVGSARMRLLFDCYHMQIMEGDLVNHIRRNLDVIGHFHAAGVPGRHEIFQGETDYRFVWAEIERLDYQGIFGLEYAPSTESTLSLKKTLEYLARR